VAAWTTIDAPSVEVYGNREDAARQRRSREQLLENAKEQFRRAGWEGDVRMGPFFAGLPTNDETGEVMVGLKQNNNGTTFIWSPFELTWLADRKA
jgi:hypothetical protein